jgi:excisionase family DNA binding protein
MKLVGVKEAALLLDVKVSWVRSCVFRRILPYYKLQRLVKFNTDELLAWLETQKQVAKRDKNEVR